MHDEWSLRPLAKKGRRVGSEKRGLDQDPDTAALGLRKPSGTDVCDGKISCRRRKRKALDWEMAYPHLGTPGPSTGSSRIPDTRN
jgi:hypothetical protein